MVASSTRLTGMSVADEPGWDASPTQPAQGMSVADGSGRIRFRRALPGWHVADEPGRDASETHDMLNPMDRGR